MYPTTATQAVGTNVHGRLTIVQKTWKQIQKQTLNQEAKGGAKFGRSQGEGSLLQGPLCWLLTEHYTDYGNPK